MFSVHVISDIFLENTEKTPDIEYQIPDVDLVILNGNISNPKRAMLYIQTLCSLHPSTSFIMNYGFHEKYIGNLMKVENEAEINESNRKKFYVGWPKNLYFNPQSNSVITLRNGYTVDIFTGFGYPCIHKVDIDWKTSYWYKNVIAEVISDIHDPRFVKPSETSNVSHGDLWVWAYPKWINLQNEIETTKARNWEITPSHYKIFVGHINPIKDSRMYGLHYTGTNIHLRDMLWVTADNYIENKMYMGARLVSNPGRGELPRSRIIKVEPI